MFKSRKAGFGLAILLGVAALAPALADTATMAAKSDVDKATGTVNDMQTFFTQLKARQAASAAAAPTVTATTELAVETMKCPVCGMSMTAEATGSMTHAVKIKGKTWYCCACNMKSVADKAPAAKKPKKKKAATTAQ